MRHLAASIAMSLDLARDAHADDRRRADAWRELHRRPDALPDPVEAAPSVPTYRRFRVTSFVIHRRHAAGDAG
jgi:hypothetical protein